MTKKELRRKQSELLVEHILNKDPISANSIFQKLIMEAEEEREQEVMDELELDDNSEDTADAEAEEVEEADDNEFDTDDAESVDGLDSEETNAKVDDIIEINCQINSKVISTLFDKIAELKNNIESLNLDPNSREYLKYDVTIQYYSDKLQDLQTKTNPGIDQAKVEEALTKITTALEQLSGEIGGTSAEDEQDISDVETPEEVSAENNLESEDEEESEEESDEEEESKDEEESEESEEEEETSEEELEEEPETKEETK